MTPNYPAGLRCLFSLTGTTPQSAIWTITAREGPDAALAVWMAHEGRSELVMTHSLADALGEACGMAAPAAAYAFGLTLSADAPQTDLGRADLVRLAIFGKRADPDSAPLGYRAAMAICALAARCPAEDVGSRMRTGPARLCNLLLAVVLHEGAQLSYPTIAGLTKGYAIGSIPNCRLIGHSTWLTRNRTAERLVRERDAEFGAALETAITELLAHNYHAAAMRMYEWRRKWEGVKE